MKLNYTKVKQGRYVGFCAIYRCIVDITFLMPFSSHWKSRSEHAHDYGLLWAIFMFIYFMIGDVAPTFIFLRIFDSGTVEKQEGDSVQGLHQSLLDKRSSSSIKVAENSSLPYKDPMCSSRAGSEHDVCSQVLQRNQLLTKSGTMEGSQLKKYKAVGLLFAAQWCPPCRDFIAALKQFYQEVNQETKQLELIFVSGDHDEEAFLDYYNMMPWTAIAFEDPIRELILDSLEVEGIPEIFILGKNGKVATRSARSDIERLGVKAIDKWVTLI